MIKDLFSLREKEIFNTLVKLKGCDFVVIGGYAVNAYTLPRFSVDCDIVVRDETELKKIEQILFRIGYSTSSPELMHYSGNFSRFEKKLDNSFFVSIDILIQDVADRLTSAKFSAEWIFENSKMRILKGKTINEELKLRIINIDALVVMKAVSCRSADIRDVFMMLPDAVDKEWIKSEISLRYNFNDRLSKIIEKVNSSQFKDGLSGVYGRIDELIFKKHLKEISKMKNIW